MASEDDELHDGRPTVTHVHTGQHVTGQEPFGLIFNQASGSRGIGGPVPHSPRFWSFHFLQKRSTCMSKKVAINKYEICLKMLEMAILEAGGAIPRPP